MNKFFIILWVLLLTACSTTEDYTPVQIQTPPTLPLVIPKAQPMQLNNDITWLVLNFDELQKLIDNVEKSGQTNFVIFALTTDGYEKLSLNMAEITRYIKEQKHINDFLIGAIKDRASGSQK